jgi:hypothetical protein
MRPQGQWTIQPTTVTVAGARPPDAFTVVRLTRSPEALGLLVDFLAGIEPFSMYDFGNFSRALQHQLMNGSHVAAVAGKRLVGYCGWLPTTSAIAAAWVADRGPLQPAPDGSDDAVAVTVIAAADRRILTALIRRARASGPGKRLYFKRHYADPTRAPRKRSVANAAF